MRGPQRYSAAGGCRKQVHRVEGSRRSADDAFTDRSDDDRGGYAETVARGLIPTVVRARFTLVFVISHLLGIAVSSQLLAVST